MVSTAKGGVHLDGVFNIISYDAVSKLQGTLMSSEFKVNTTDFHAWFEMQVLVLFYTILPFLVALAQ